MEDVLLGGFVQQAADLGLSVGYFRFLPAGQPVFQVLESQPDAPFQTAVASRLLDGLAGAFLEDLITGIRSLLILIVVQAGILPEMPSFLKAVHQRSGGLVPPAGRF